MAHHSKGIFLKNLITLLFKQFEIEQYEKG